MFDQSDQELTLFLAGCTLARVPGNQNWLEEKAVGGLPEYICRIARAIHRSDASKSISQVIAIAVSRAKAWAAGGGGVTAKTRAKAAKAVAEWEAKKKAAKLDNKVKMSNLFSEEDLVTSLTDAQLEKATMIPCTQKDNRSLLENVKLAHELRMEQADLMKMSAPVLELASRTFSSNSREKMASKGTALSDGSYPIPDRDALRRAIQSYGRAKPEDRAKVKAHIMKRARALNAMDMIPDSWRK